MFADLLSNHASVMVAGGAMLPLLFQIYKFVVEKRQQLYWTQFEKYHGLVKQLVAPDQPNDQMYIDRQTAIIFELGNFPRYSKHTLRMLKGLKRTWPPGQARLHEELDLTITKLEPSRPA